MTTTSASTSTPTEVTADAFAERMFNSSLGALETLSMYFGDRLGWYRSLVADGPATSAELAARTGTHERYVREWLEGQAVFGILTTDTPGAGAAERRYELPPAAAEVLTDGTSLSYLGPLPRMLMIAAAQMPSLFEAYRSGGGVSWEQMGVDARESQAEMNRPWYERRLGEELANLPDLHRVLDQDGARILDVGCGGGWSTISIARAYPGATVVGVDVDAPSVEMARANAVEARVSDRVAFRHADAGSISDAGEYDAAFAFECIHDMPRPVEVLGYIRRAVRPDGAVVVMDEAVADDFTAPGDELERLMYGISMLVCLPDGMSSQPSVGTGTVIRRSTMEGYAREAGFDHVEVLPIEDFGFWRFYRLHH